MNKDFFKKDGVLYWFASRRVDESGEINNNPYGVSQVDKRAINAHLLQTLAYYKDSYIQVNDEKIPLFQLATAANIRPERYQAELSNRVNTMRLIANELKFTQPVFITITAPTEYHRLTQIKIKDKFIKLVDNPKFAGFSDPVQAAREYLTDLWSHFARSRLFREIKQKYGANTIYLKVFEPHIDGTPHLHILAFIPPEYKKRFVENLINFRETKIDIKTEFDGDLGGVVSYLIKYVLKTFKDGKSGELSPVAYWYIKNHIRRFTTSQTLIPLGVYQKIKSSPEFRNLLEMTHLYKAGFISFDLVANNARFLECLQNGEKMKSTDYIKDSILIGVAGFDFIEYKIAYKRADSVAICLKNRDKKIIVRDLRAISRLNDFDDKTAENISLDFLIDGLGFEPEINYNPFEFKPCQRSAKNGERLPVSAMKDSTLYNYYKTLDTFSANLQHLALVENELLKRGFKECLNGLEVAHNLNALDLENFIEREKRYYDF